MIISKNEFDACLVKNQKLLLHYKVLERPNMAIEDKMKDKDLFIKHVKRLRPSEPIREPKPRDEEENGAAK